MTSAFDKYCESMFDDAFGAISANLAGQEYHYKMSTEITRYVFECLDSFEYHHHDQDIHNGLHKFEKGKEYKNHSKELSIYFLPKKYHDKFKFLREETTGHKAGEKAE